MIFTIVHQGIPVVRTGMTRSEIAAGDVEPMPALAPLLPVIRADFMNVIETPTGGMVAIARFANAHAEQPAVRRPTPQADGGEEPGVAG